MLLGESESGIAVESCLSLVEHWLRDIGEMETCVGEQGGDHGGEEACSGAKVEDVERLAGNIGYEFECDVIKLMEIGDKGWAIPVIVGGALIEDLFGIHGWVSLWGKGVGVR